MFTVYTDVWSFGVTMWEIFTFGRAPFALGAYVVIYYTYDHHAQCIVPAQTLSEELRRGLRLPKPLGMACSDDVYRIMSACWSLLPQSRPKFHKICSMIEELKDSCKLIVLIWRIYASSHFCVSYTY